MNATDLYQGFVTWCQGTGRTGRVTQRRFGAIVSQVYNKKKSGTVAYIGLRLKEE